MRLLEHKAESDKPELCELGFAEVGEFAVVDTHSATGGPIESAERMQQRRFAGPGRPHDGHELFVVDADINMVEDSDLVILGDLVRVKHG